MEKHREKYKSSDHHHHHHQPQVMMPPLVGLSWPPRSYTCSFCKREFRSAQALGGHMNVHRRDRARLRQSSPPSYPNYSILKPNPKSPNNVPNLNMPPPISSLTRDDKPSPPPFTLIISPHASSPTSSSSSSSSTSFLFGVREWRNFMGTAGGRKDDDQVMKHGLDVDGSLDLELRLGYT